MSLPFKFSLSFINSLIRKIEIYYQGPGKLNVLTVYPADYESLYIVGYLLTGLRLNAMESEWQRGILSPPEMVGMMSIKSKLHDQQLHAIGDQKTVHNHIILTDIEPTFVLDFVRRIIAIQQDPLIRMNCQIYKPPLFLLYSLLGPAEKRKGLIDIPILSEEGQRRLVEAYTEKYSLEKSECPLFLPSDIPDFLNDSLLQPQYLRITGSSELQGDVRLAATNITEQAFRANALMIVIFITLVWYFCNKILKDCFKPKLKLQENEDKTAPSFRENLNESFFNRKTGKPDHVNSSKPFGVNRRKNHPVRRSLPKDFPRERVTFI